MDCPTFRKHHLAYLDDTLSGDLMADAQLHVFDCASCAAHDTLVRRSLMMVRNLPVIEPSDAFSARLQARLAACREMPRAEDDDEAYLDGFLDTQASHRTLRVMRGPRIWLAMAAGVTVMGTVALRSNTGSASEIQLAPVLASAPPVPATLPPMVSAELVQAMATGNPMWPLTLLVEDAPAHFLATSSEFDGAR